MGVRGYSRNDSRNVSVNSTLVFHDLPRLAVFQPQICRRFRLHTSHAAKASATRIDFSFSKRELSV
jgi:hypothetical protein